MTAPDLRTSVGSVALPNPVMTASGTGGHGAELSAYMDLSELGAVVVKSLLHKPWAGNSAPRVHELSAGMINAVGLPGPGVDRWIEEYLPDLRKSGARIVASIWGQTVEDYATAATKLATVEDDLTAIEVNISCPNTEAGGKMFAHDRLSTAEVMSATASLNKSRWVKLSPNTPEVVEIAGIAIEGGADALVLTNTLMGTTMDQKRRRLRLGNGTGGVSGAAIHPIALRWVHACHAAYPQTPLVGVGGVASAEDAIDFFMAGASAVQVGTATFLDPRASIRILRDLEKWCVRSGVGAITDLIGVAHTSRSELPPTEDTDREYA